MCGRRNPLPRLFARLGVATLLCLSACGGGPATRIPPYHLPQIDTIELQGVTRFSTDELLGYLHLHTDSWVPFSPDAPFDPAWVPLEIGRIEALYRQAGFPKARVTAFEAKPDDNDEVQLTIRIDEGERVRVRSLVLAWQEPALPADLRAQVESKGALTIEGPFSIEALNDTVGSLRQALRAKGYPHARVTSAAEVYDDALRADVTLHVMPGPHATVGGFRYEGLVDVPVERVRREVDFALGKEDTPAVESRVERAASGLDVFRWVTVEPADTVVDGKVDLIVKVAETRPQALRLGLGFTFESNRWEERVTADYTHLNLFGDLTRLDLSLTAGWAELPSPFQPQATGPMVEVAPALTRKGLFEPYLLWTLRPAFEVGIEDGYQYWSPTGLLGVSRWFAGRYKAEVSQNVRYLRFFNLSPDLDAKKSILGRDFRDPYFLSYAEVRGDAYFTDEVLAPKNGVALSASYDVAGGVLGGDFDHQKIVGGARGWWQPMPRLKLATHAETGLIYLYGDSPAVPFDRRLYLGGADAVRGFGQRRLSPQIRDCDTGTHCAGLPVGGLTSIMAMSQAQFRVGGPVWVAGFFDLGDVRPGEGSYDVSHWNYSAGPGLRVDTPVGLVRLDVGFRLNAPGDYPDEPAWAMHFGLGESL